MNTTLLPIIALAFAALFQTAGNNQVAPIRVEVDSPRIQKLKQQVAVGDTKAVDEFWRALKVNGAPLIETIAGDRDHSLISFVYRGDGSTNGVVVFSQLSYSTGPAGDQLVHLAGTDVWYKSFLVRNDTRISYSFRPNSTADIPDPLNPKTVPPGTNVGRSVLELPGAPDQPWIKVRPGAKKGELVEQTVKSAVLKTDRRFWIYTPPGFDPKRAAAYPLLICFDGDEYWNADQVPTPTILDNLIADVKIPPIVAVFIDQAPQPQRNIELGNNEPFVEFVTNEVLPIVRKQARATADPRQTIVCGSSAGGLGSAFFAFKRPDVYGNVLSQSGAFWPGQKRSDPDREWITRQYEASPKLPVRFVLQVGAIEVWNTVGNGPSIRDVNRHLRDVLFAKGYSFSYQETGGAHEPLSWRGGIAEGLIWLIAAPK
ncbi:MAG: alpha/beta hydrolase-fold protein [Pyrinomonadaceae bacterium]